MQDQMILMSTALVYLLSLPLAFVYFLHVTLSSLKIKKSSIKKRSTTKTTSYGLEKIYNKWVALIRKKIEDSIKDGLIKTATTTGIFYVLKVANIKPPKASLDAMDIMKLADRIVGGVLVKDYAVYKKWINGWCYNKHFMALLRVIKLHDTIGWEENVRLVSLVLRFRSTPRAMEGYLYVISSRHFTLSPSKNFPTRPPITF